MTSCFFILQTPATYVSEGVVTCETPQRTPRKVTRGPKDGTDPYPGGDDNVRTAEVVYDETRIDTISPCFVSAVSVANDGMKFSDASPVRSSSLISVVYLYSLYGQFD